MIEQIVSLHFAFLDTIQYDRFYSIIRFLRSFSFLIKRSQEMLCNTRVEQQREQQRGGRFLGSGMALVIKHPSMASCGDLFMHV